MATQPGVGYTFTTSSQGENINVIQPWENYVPVMNVDVCPFTIKNESVSTTYQFSCTAGMVNSVIPQIGIVADSTKRLDQLPVPTTTFNFDTSTYYSYIYLKVSWLSGTPDQYPVTDQTDILYPRIISTSVEQVSDDNSGYFLLATAYQDPSTMAITIWQLTCGSQWSDRLKTGTDTARYYFARS